MLPDQELTSLMSDLESDRVERKTSAADILQQNHRSTEQQLAALRLLASDMQSPTVAGLPAVGKSPADFVPGAWIPFLRIDGTQLTDPIVDQK